MILLLTWVEPVARLQIVDILDLLPWCCDGQPLRPFGLSTRVTTRNGTRIQFLYLR